MYEASVGAGWITRTEFWTMHPTELWWLIESKRPRRMFGKMTEAEVEAIYEDEYGPPPEWVH